MTTLTTPTTMYDLLYIHDKYVQKYTASTPSANINNEKVKVHMVTKYVRSQ